MFIVAPFSHNSEPSVKTSLSLSTTLCHLHNSWDDLSHGLGIFEKDSDFPSSLPGTCGNLAQLDDLSGTFHAQQTIPGRGIRDIQGLQIKSSRKEGETQFGKALPSLTIKIVSVTSAQRE